MFTGPDEEDDEASESPLPPQAVRTARAVAVPAMTRVVLVQLGITSRLL
jgi:hypothetical protein